MITTVSNFGGRLGIRFPEWLLEKTLISENDDVEIDADEDRIIIKYGRSKKHLTTKERIAAFYETATDSTVELTATDWGKPQGKEVW